MQRLVSSFVASCAAVLAMVGCADAPTRSAEKFCGELSVHTEAIRTLPTTVGETAALIQLYSRMGEVAPLEVETDWSQLVAALKAADAINVADPASAQTVTDKAYQSQKSAEAVVQWARDTCGIDLGQVGVVADGPIATSTTTTVAG